MKVSVRLHNSLPGNGDFWQIVLIPTISLFRSVDGGHFAVNAEWLFWSITLINEKK